MNKFFCFLFAGIITLVYFWKIYPIATRYKGYIYNAIVLNTFQKVSSSESILLGEYFQGKALVIITLFGILFMAGILAVSFIRKKESIYLVLFLIIVSDVFLIHVNYKKIRKASNDYVVEATEQVVTFMDQFEEAVVEEFPFVLKGGLPGVKIQFYQSQLMSYKMFGTKQEDMLQLDNYFIIVSHDEIDAAWYDEDYYMFEDFDYDNAKYDIVLVKGASLMDYMESIGYEMKLLQ